MADGYVLIEVNTEGKARLQEGQIHWIDFRLGDADFEASEGLDQLMSQLPDDLKDALVMVLFNYRVESSYDSWSGATEYEDFYDVDSHVVARTNYKEFFRNLITAELNVGINGFENLKCIPPLINGESINYNYYKNIVEDWEEFYDEDFEPS